MFLTHSIQEYNKTEWWTAGFSGQNGVHVKK